MFKYKINNLWIPHFISHSFYFRGLTFVKQSPFLRHPSRRTGALHQQSMDQLMDQITSPGLLYIHTVMVLNSQKWFINGHKWKCKTAINGLHMGYTWVINGM